MKVSVEKKFVTGFACALALQVVSGLVSYINYLPKKEGVA